MYGRFRTEIESPMMANTLTAMEYANVSQAFKNAEFVENTILPELAEKGIGKMEQFKSLFAERAISPERQVEEQEITNMETEKAVLLGQINEIESQIEAAKAIEVEGRKSVNEQQVGDIKQEEH